MRRILAAATWVLGALAWQAARAQDAPPDPPPERPNFEGAVGLQLNNLPEYPGSARRTTSVRPGLYLRWGRFSIATAGSFVTRRDDDVARGLGADLVQRDDLQVQLGLRYDPGRKTSDSGDLAGHDEVRPTLRARVAGTWRPDRDWHLGAAWSTDLLGRGGGSLVDLTLRHDVRLGPRTVWSLGSSVSWADRRYMAARFGVSPEAAARTGEPAYAPGAGLRDVAASMQLRFDIDRRWSVWGGGSVGRLLGPTLDSPLTRRPTQAAIGAGFAWRFR